MRVYYVCETQLTTVSGVDLIAGECPVFCVGDDAGGFGFYVEAIDLEVIQGRIRIRPDVKCLGCARCLDVPDVNVAEMRQSLLLRNLGRERNPIRRDILRSGRQCGVTVAGVPVHRDVNGNGNSFQRQIMDAYIAGGPAACVRRLEEYS